MQQTHICESAAVDYVDDVRFWTVVQLILMHANTACQKLILQTQYCQKLLQQVQVDALGPATDYMIGLAQSGISGFYPELA